MILVRVGVPAAPRLVCEELLNIEALEALPFAQIIPPYWTGGRAWRRQNPLGSPPDRRC